MEFSFPAATPPLQQILLIQTRPHAVCLSASASLQSWPKPRHLLWTTASPFVPLRLPSSQRMLHHNQGGPDALETEAGT